MPRKGPAPKRQILPDPKYNSKILARFINKVMLSGKKSTAEQVTYGALDLIAERTGRDPYEIGDFRSPEAMWITRAIEIFMMVDNDVEHLGREAFGPS